ncbi:MAG: ABC transporter ATP-binding protein [Halobacteriaceae archaeon]
MHQRSTSSGNQSESSGYRTGDPGQKPEQQPILDVANLRTTFYTEKETIRAVDDISFNIYPGETVGIVGESGSGKTVTARSIMRLIESPGRIEEGSSIRYREPELVRELATKFGDATADISDIEKIQQDQGFDTRKEAFDYIVDDDDFIFIEEYANEEYKEEISEGYIDLSRASEEGQRKVRGNAIAMIFQDPLTSLNPVYTIGNQILEAIELHRDLEERSETELAIDLLEAVGIPDAERRLNEYPHQFSGGMRQRVVIAMALACQPEVLICDEPTTALDVTIQAQILDLLMDLQESRGLSMMFITHDMGVIAQVSDRVNVMYAGEIVETATVTDLYENPRHPYTRGLMESIPGLEGGQDRLETIEGEVPTPTERPTYCRFAPRCPEAFEDCTEVHPVPVPVEQEGKTDHTAACLLYPEDESQMDAVERHRSHIKDHHALEKERDTT